ncbi:hypothetical protein RB653_001931 [Dictyostelium firmibasis]|uniref:Aminotransferase class I/classII large domain-containing protein n=1 Tax=Dictyostelium firmibasis TaxID=79012 RepID=A0AAN7YML0_9MYCE
MKKENYEGFSDNAIRLLSAPKGNSKLAMAHFIAMSDLFNSKSNPNGYISLGIAENVLSYDILKEKLVLGDSKESGEVTAVPPQVLTQYSDIGGIPQLRELIAVELLQNQVFKGYKPTNNKLLVKKEQILVSGGATPLLENVFNLFCNEGEKCIIPSPFYPSFVYDAFQRFGVKVVAAKSEVFNDNDEIIDFKLDLDVFESLYNQGGVKMVLLCNPNNPTGYIFKPTEIKQLVNWCHSKKIHLISDEIYALSVFNENGNEFKSIYEILEGDLGEYVHILNGFSKDFCLNGYRIGYFYSQNEMVFRYMVSTSAFYSCSNIAQYTAINILKDREYLERYIKTNQKNLKEAYEFASNLLNQYSIPFIKSSSGVFLSLDLRACLKCLPDEDDEDNKDAFSKEIKLWEAIFGNKVFLNSGKLCYFDKPGFFRLVFTLPKDFVEQGIKRIATVYNSLLNK